MRAGMQNNIPEITDRLKRVEWAVKSQYKQKVTRALEETREELQRTTPKATGKMASGWRKRVIGGSAKGRVPVAGWIWNVFAEKSRWRYQSRSVKARFTKLETGRINTVDKTIKTDGRRVLQVLEYGSQPHVIRAAHALKSGKPGFLAFQPWSTGSRRAGSMTQDGVVFARKVQHPGTKPHGMIRRARMTLRGRIRKVNEEVGAVARQVMAGRG